MAEKFLPVEQGVNSIDFTERADFRLTYPPEDRDWIPAPSGSGLVLPGTSGAKLKFTLFDGLELGPAYSIPLPKLTGDFSVSILFRPMSREYDIDGFEVVGHATGERWKRRNGEWVASWSRKRAETRKPQGRARYERRYANGN